MEREERDKILEFIKIHKVNVEELLIDILDNCYAWELEENYLWLGIDGSVSIRIKEEAIK